MTRIALFVKTLLPGVSLFLKPFDVGWSERNIVKYFIELFRKIIKLNTKGKSSSSCLFFNCRNHHDRYENVLCSAALVIDIMYREKQKKTSYSLFSKAPKLIR